MKLLRTFHLSLNGSPAQIEALISHTSYEILDATSGGRPVDLSLDDLERFEQHVDSQIVTSETEAYCFESEGQIYLDVRQYPEDQALEAALEAGADDMTTDDDQHVITTEAAKLHRVRAGLEERRFVASAAEIELIPTTTVLVKGKTAEQLLKLTDALEEHDDVAKVSSNFDIDQETLAAVSG